ncbi:hypothetical protein [Clostridium sp.]|uniref:hypothetical protein n=1 Tax=Clostridium sp. TaxID=1506 RepID=UPI003994497D
MKTREQYEKWLHKNIEGWTKSTQSNFINIVLKSGKHEAVELSYFTEPNKDKFTKDELVIALLNKKY